MIEEDGLEQLSVGGHGAHEFSGELGEGGVSRGENSEGAVTYGLNFDKITLAKIAKNTCESVSKAGLDGEINEG